MSERYSQYLEEIRQKVSIVDLVSADGCKLRRKGRAMAGLSPFRQEKDPSFYVYPDQNSWFDFGEEAGGDIFAYVMRRDGCDFKTASSKLGEFGGVERYWEHNAFAEKDKFMAEVLSRTEMFAVYNLLTEAADWYAHGLPEHARKIYRDNYGLSDETLERLKFGWGAVGLWEYFRETSHYSEEMCLKTGLFIVTSEGVKDFFANRLTMPYIVGGQVRYMIGRRVEGYTADTEYEKGKYKKLLTRTDNRKYISLHVSNDVFFNEDVVKHGMAELVITEGITDCAAFDQHGFPCISPVTTTFNEASKPRLARLAEKAGKKCKFIVCNDNDVLDDGKKPGERGAIATAGFLFSLGFQNVHIATIPRPPEINKVDSCDYLRTHGAEAMHTVLVDSRKLLEYLIDSTPENLEPEQLGAHLEPIVEAIATLEPIARAAHVDRIAKRFKLPKAAILEKIGLVPDVELPSPQATPGEEPPPSKKKRSTIEGDGRVRGQVFEEIGESGGFYMARAKDGTMEQISSFLLVPRCKLAFEDHELLQCDIQATTGRIIRDFVFQRKAWTSARNFKDAFSIPDLQWTGTDDQVQGVLSLLSEVDVKVRSATQLVGYHDASGKRLWIWPGNVLDQHGVVADPDVSHVRGQNSSVELTSRLDFSLSDVDDTRRLASEVYPLLLQINEPSIVMLLIGWFFASPFKPRIRRHSGQFPILYVWGSGGSGKTTVVRLFWKMFGVTRGDSATEPFSADDTPYTLLVKFASTTSIPLFFDELKKKDMRSDRYNNFVKTLREIYVGKTGERGKSDLSVVTYNMAAPTIVASESVPDEDPALMERLVCVSPLKSTIDDESTGAKRAYRALQKLPYEKLAGPYAHWTLNQEIEPVLNRAKAVAEHLLARVAGDGAGARVIEAATVVAFGLLQFDAWCKHLGVTLPDLDPAIAFSSLVSQVIRGEGSSVKDAFDFFLEQVSTYIHMGLLHEGRDFVLVDDRRPRELRTGDCAHLLRLHLPSCFETYLVERRRTGREDETNGLRALQRVAKEKSMRRGSYIIDPSVRTDLRNPNPIIGRPGVNERGQVRCVEIDQDAVPDALDFRRLSPASVLHRKADVRYDPAN